jgi:D-alanyl-D-alanine carboxypeptidase/D-alanyl-D-alanine-endopeptidase (penicillin-binding protein 4)
MKISKRLTIRWVRLCLLLLLPSIANPALALDRGKLEAALRHPNLEGARVGIEIRNLATEETVFSRNAHAPLILASNTKLVTTAAALHHLGEDYAFQTRLYARGEVRDGMLDGDLLLRGGGDPTFSERVYQENPLAPLDTLAASAAEAGIRRVKGALLLDDTIFDREFTAPGWPADQLNRTYCAPVSGLSVLENLVWLETRPAASAGSPALLTLFPADAPFTLSGRILTTSNRKDHLIHIGRPRSDGRIDVSGRVYTGNPSSRYAVAVRFPTRYFGALFMGALKRAGVIVEGEVRCTERAPDYEAPGVTLLEELDSGLVPAIQVTNKDSVNHYAEQIFKLTGWKVAGKGTFAAGETAVRQFFLDRGITEIDPIRMADGSGLSRGNRFSAHTLVALLDAMYDSPFRDAYLRSLPIAGVDGTLERRMTEEPYRMRVRAKTGWINAVSALSGYAQSLGGDVYAFSILFNDYKGGNSTMKGVQDRICRVLVDG